MSREKTTSVVIDCDPGNDDAWAVITLLKSEAEFNIKVKAITIANGNTSVENGSRNVLLLLKTLNRLDIPVYPGAESSLLIKPGYYPRFFGTDGFKDVYDNKPSPNLVQKKHAVEALKEIIETVKNVKYLFIVALQPLIPFQNENEIVIFGVAPLTNIALLYKIYPEISSKIKSLWIMGGNHSGKGNVTRAGEFNFWNDPEAAHIVLRETKCPIFIFPWETAVETSKATPMDEWRLSVLSSNDNVTTKLMDATDKGVRKDGNFIACDAYLTSCFVVPKMIRKMVHEHVTVELGGNHTRGMMVIDHKRLEKPNAFIIHEIDKEMFKRFLCWVCDHHEYDIEFCKRQHNA